MKPSCVRVRLLRLACLWIILLGAGIAGAGAQPARGPRPIDLDVDASEAARRIFHARLVIPAAPGPLTLVYPKWIPGEHGPTGPVTDVAGLKMRAGGRDLPWRRDEVDMYAFHLEVPEGMKSVEVSFDLLSAAPASGKFSAGASASDKLAAISWNQVLLYPPGRASRDIQFRASLSVPAGWKIGTALPIASQSGARTVFAPVSLETLVDSPVLCGAYFREIPIGPPGKVPHYLELAADSPEALEIPKEIKAGYDRLVEEALALFGVAHYSSYRFLVSLSDHVAHFGLEHHASSDDRLPERALIDEDWRKLSAGLLPHEFVHSWNAKYRRPADLATADFQQPMRTSLLWVYEGLTQYLGTVLEARSGLRTPEQTRERLALLAEWARNQRGRAWRPLEDTATAAQLLYQARSDWSAWRRGVDFYDESVLLWMDVDTLIREKTQGRRSLDDFCRRFHGGPAGPAGVKTYTLDEVVADLDAVAPYDWRALLTERVTAASSRAPLEGLERGGWRLAYADTRSDLLKTGEDKNDIVNLTASLGLLLKKDGWILDIIPGKAAGQAGIAPGARVVAVNSRRFTPEVARAAIAATRGGVAPLELLVENDDYFRTYPVNYREGEKYPRLERDAARPDLLSEILKPLVPPGAPATPAAPPGR